MIRTHARRPRTRILVIAGIALLLAIAPLTAGINAAWAFFSAHDDLPVAIGAGSVALAWDDGESNQFGSSIGDLHPGHSIERVADLTNRGSLPLGVAELAFAGAGVGTISDGVQVAIDRCSVAWTVAASVFTCSGTTAQVTASRPSSGVVRLDGSPVYSAGKTDHLRFTFAVPTSSPPTADNTTGSVVFIASGVVDEARRQ